jgi:hypothetical protein
MGATKAICWAPLFSIETLIILGIQPTTMFCLAVTLCDNGATSDMMVRLEDICVLFAIPHLVFKANRMKVSKVQHES